MFGRTSDRITVVMAGLVLALSPDAIVQGEVHITAISPAAGQIVPTGRPELLIDLSGAIDVSTATTDSIRICQVGDNGLVPDADDTPLALASIVAESGNTRLRITTQSPLGDGDYVWAVYGSASSRSGPGNALYFSNNVAYLNLSALSTLGTSFTLEAWSRIDCCTSYGSHGYGAVFDWGQNGRNIPGVILEHQQANWRFYCRRPDGTESQAVATGGLVLGEWQHIAAVASPSGMKLYINGVLQASIPDTCNPSAMASYFQTALTGYTRWAGAYDYILGYFDDMRVWNVARSQAEIQACMYTPLAGNEPGLLVYYPLDETDGDVLTDVTGHGYDGTRGTAQWQASPAPLILMSTIALTGADGIAVDTNNDAVPGGVLVSTFHVDSTAPRVVALTPAFDACPIVLQPAALAAHFSDTMSQTTLIPANIALIASGGDEIIGNGNDVAVPFTPSYDSATKTLTLTPGSPFANEAYRLTLADAIQNAAGYALDGEYPGAGGSGSPLPSGDGIAGGAFILDFTINNDFDCNNDGLADACELTGNDLNGNGVPDDCEDCNRNSILDECDLDCGPSGGYCDVPGCGQSTDCNANGVLDECDTTPQDYALSFDDTNDYVRVPRTSSLEPGQFTIEMWANINGQQSRNTRIIRKANSAGYIFAADQDNDHLVQLRTSTVYVKDTQSHAAYANQWHHFAATYTATQARLYVDGVLKNTVNHTAGQLTYDTSDIYFGTGYFGSSDTSEYFGGRLDEIRIWNYARSQEEIQNAMNELLTGTETGLVGYWRMDEGTGQTVTDRSPNGNHGIRGANGYPEGDVSDPTWVSRQTDVLLPDCNGNQRPDSCDLADGTSADCNASGIPDECELNHAPLTPPVGSVTNPSNGHYYLLTSSAMSWPSAEAYAVSLGGHVATVRNAAENQWIAQTFDPLTTQSSIFIGFNDIDIEGTWKWSSGEASTFTNWRSGQPDNNGNEDWGELRFSDGSWNDVSSNRYALVEIPPTNDCNQNEVLDECDIASGASTDCNGNDIPDDCEFGGASDCNNNGAIDMCEPGGAPDCNGNQIPDQCDIYVGTSADCNADGIPDDCWLETGHQVDVTHRYRACIDGSSQLILNGSTVQWHQLSGGAAAPGREPGCSGNQPTYIDEVEWLPDWPEAYPAPIRYDAYSSIYSALSPPYPMSDMTIQIHLISYRDPVTVNLYPSAANSYTIIIDIPDSSSGPFWYDFEVIAIRTIEVDCNNNEILDECDIAAGTSQDCNENGIPDECEFGGASDCNDNGVIDLCEPGGALDCNGNQLPDQCDINAGTSTDCNGNGIPDECDLAVSDWALDFDGNTDYVKVPRSAAFEPANELTIEAWVKSHGPGEQHARIVRKTNGRGYILAWEQQNDKRAQIRIDGAAQGGVNVADTVSTDTYVNQWHHLAATYSATGNYVRLYVDGVLKNSAAAKGQLLYGTDDLYFGNWSSSSEGFDGLIDEIRIWNVARTQAQIQANMNRPLSGTEAGLVGYWRFNEAAGQTTQDSTRFANHGRLGDTTGIDTTDPAWIISTSPMLYGDCNNNGVLDECDIAAGTSQDCNENGMPDECEPDCNGNGVADACDLSSGTSQDCNGNAIPDECEPGHELDCNQNGIIDFCEVGGTTDCNNNGKPDLCDLYDGTSQDCNANHIPDSCDIAAGRSTDVNANGIPDECELDIRVIPVVTLIDPAGTSEARNAQPATMTAIVQGSAYYVEIWASDVGSVNTGLTGVYVDVNFCSATAASELFHGGIFATFPIGTIQSGKVDEFGGSALPHGGGIEPQWVRVGWIRMTSGVASSSCAITLTPASNGIGAYTRGLINPAFIQHGSVNLTITPSQVSYDLDSDTYIGVGDLSLFAGSWLHAVPPGQTAHDFDCDDYVGVGDLSWFATGWQKYTTDPTILYPPCLGKSAGADQEGGDKSGSADAEFRLIVRTSLSPSDVAVTVPSSVTTINSYQQYYLEIWASDVGDVNTGLTSAYVDLIFQPQAVSVLSINHQGLFTVFPSGSTVGAQIDELGGSILSAGTGVEPLWSRVASVRVFVGEAPPLTVFRLQPSATGVAAYSRGEIEWPEVVLGEFTYGQAGLGDVNADGFVDVQDVSVFVGVLMGTDSDPGHAGRADMNGDALNDGLDIQLFVEALLGGQ
jgi:hypothetical protein